MNETEEKLRKETEKWLGRLETELPGVKPEGGSAKKHFENMKAYVSDSRHFLLKKDFIRAFECAVWAWSIYELCAELGMFEKK
ncbi:MAG: DUF357 domain-containing protein [Nanoarchaeota archaeon]|nr:DUF357 domain-containing protein [Nanoarchaeota archaeon]